MVQNFVVETNKDLKSKTTEVDEKMKGILNGMNFNVGMNFYLFLYQHLHFISFTCIKKKH